jgi:CBS domain-containing protein
MQHAQRTKLKRNRVDHSDDDDFFRNRPTKEQSMKVKEIITPDPECISPDASLTEAARKMRLLDVGILLVGEQDKLVGAVTDRDITVRAVAEGLDPKTVKVRQIMTKDVVCCYEDRNIEEAAHLMEEKQIRRLPVVDEQKRLVGIVSLADLAVRAHYGALASEVLESVSSRTHAPH